MEKELVEIKQRVVDELCELKKKNPLTPSDIQSMGELVDMVKDFDTIEAMEKYGYYNWGEYSNLAMPKIDRHDYSMRRGRSPITGQYVSRDSDYNGGQSYTNYTQGYSGHNVNDRMIDALERLYDTAQTEHERIEISQEIERLKRN